MRSELAAEVDEADDAVCFSASSDCGDDAAADEQDAAAAALDLLLRFEPAADERAAAVEGALADGSARSAAVVGSAGMDCCRALAALAAASTARRAGRDMESGERRAGVKGEKRREFDGSCDGLFEHQQTSEVGSATGDKQHRRTSRLSGDINRVPPVQSELNAPTGRRGSNNTRRRRRTDLTWTAESSDKADDRIAADLEWLTAQ